MARFTDILNMAVQLGFVPEKVDHEEQLFHVSDESEGVKNLIIDCEDSIVILEQVVMQVTEKTDYQTLMRLNNELTHGAFCLDDDVKWVLWRDTLQLNTLDPEELAASINALSLAMAEHVGTLLAMSRAK